MRGQGYADTSIADGNAVRLCLTAVSREAVPAVERLMMHFDLGGVEQVMPRRHELNPFEVQWGGCGLLPQVPLRGTQRLSIVGRRCRPQYPYLRILIPSLPRQLVPLLTY